MQLDAVSLWPADGSDVVKFKQANIGKRKDRVCITVKDDHADAAGLPGDVTGWFVYASMWTEIEPDGRAPIDALVPVYEGNVTEHDPNRRVSSTCLYCQPAGFLDPR